MSGTGIIPERRAVAPPAGLPGFSPYARPTSPPFLLELFDDGELAGTEFDPGDDATFTEEDDDRLTITSSNPGANTIGSRVYALPDDPPYNITLGVNIRAICEDYAAAGIVVGGDNMLSSPATAKLFALYNLLFLTDGPGARIEFSSYTSYAVFNTLQKRSTLLAAPLLRLHYDGSHLSALASYTGNDFIRFWRINTSTYLGSDGVPRYVGPYVLNDDTGNEIAASFPLLRVDVTADEYARCGEWFT